MSRIGSKQPMYTDPCVAWLERLSKSALIDCVVDLLRGQGECCDDPVGELSAAARLQTVIMHRGDRLPPSAEIREAKRIERRRMRATFNKALKIAKREKLERQIAAAEALAED